MGKNDDRKHVHDLAVFALKVLRMLEENEDWDADMLEEMSSEAVRMEFAQGSPIVFCRRERGRRFKDTWYGPSSEGEEAHRVGDHVERDFH